MSLPYSTFTPAPLTDGGGMHFGDPAAEAEAAARETCVAPLAHLGLITASGADAESFLQGQFSNDVRTLASGDAQLSSYNSAKGRMLAMLQLWREDAGYALEIEREILPAVLKRLRMYVLRAKVKLDEDAARLGLGLSGPAAPALLAEAGLPAPETAQELARVEDASVLRQPGTWPRYSIHAGTARAESLWSTLASRARPVGTNAWRRLDIDAGLPTVLAATQDHFVPQMADLDRLGGISFTKGCYPGQEIVARLHYLGEAKRALFRLEGGGRPQPGEAVLDEAGAALGELVIAARLPQGRSLALAVLQKSVGAEACVVGGGHWQARPAYSAAA